MIIYAETNFLFELGLARAQQGSCRRLLDWCHAGKIELRLPTFAIPEVRTALRRREAARLEVIRGLETQRTDAERHSVDPSSYAEAQDGLRGWTVDEGERMMAVTQELFRVAKFVPLDFHALEHASRLRDLRAVTGDADLFILASIVRDLELRQAAGDRAPSLVVTGDADFTKARSYLSPYSCDLLTSYSAAVARLKGQTT